MSHSKYIKDFDMHQLKALREIVNDKIDALDKEQKVLLWAVSDRYLRHKYFKQQEYLAAVEYLCKKAAILASESEDYRADKDDLSLSLDPCIVPSSEVEQYLNG